MRSLLRLSRAVVLCVPVCVTCANADQWDDGPRFVPGAMWSGLYVGVHESGAWGESDWRYSDGSTTSPGFETGAMFGGHVGYQQQWYGLVAGIDVSYSGVPNVEASAWCPGHVGVCENAVEGLLLINGRLGYAIDQVLLYGTGGYARAKIEAQTDLDDPALNLRDDRRVSGWNIGGGAEYLVTPNVIFGLEYLHVDLDDETFAMRNAAGTYAQAVNVDAEFDLVRARFTVKLDHAGEALSRLK